MAAFVQEKLSETFQAVIMTCEERGIPLLAVASAVVGIICSAKIFSKKMKKNS